VTTIQNGEPFTITDGSGATIYGAGTSRAALASPGVCDVNGNCKSTVPLITSGGKAVRVDPNNPNANWLNTSAFIAMGSITASSPYCIGGTYNAIGDPNAPCGANFGTPGFPLGSTWIGAGTGYGNSGVGSVTGPGQFNFDMVLAKRTKIWEHGSLEFRAEAYNIWNHAQFNPPAGISPSTSATFGKITSTSVTPRVVQFGLKYIF